MNGEKSRVILSLGNREVVDTAFRAHIGYVARSGTVSDSTPFSAIFKDGIHIAFGCEYFQHFRITSLAETMA